MKNSASPWILALILAIFFGCMQEDEDPAGPAAPDGKSTGSAEIRLPALPAGFLAKTAQDTVGDSTDVMFILTISGSGMVARKQAWPLSTAGGHSVYVDKIPVGSRLFKGELEVDGSVTHADSVWTAVEGGRTARVNLKLLSASGNAEVCVEIEGFPLPVGCRPPEPPADSNIAGCYSLQVNGGMGVVSGRLRIAHGFQAVDTTLIDRPLKGFITWASGESDSSAGLIAPDGTVRFGIPANANAWELRGRFSPGDGVLRGSYFYHGGRNFGGAFTAHPDSCAPGRR